MGRIFKFLKIKKIIEFFVKICYSFTKNRITLPIFKNLKIRPRVAQIMLFSRAEEIYIQIRHDLRVQTFVSVTDVVILKLFLNQAVEFPMAAAAGSRMTHHLLSTI